MASLGSCTPAATGEGRKTSPASTRANLLSPLDAAVLSGRVCRRLYHSKTIRRIEFGVAKRWTHWNVFVFKYKTMHEINFLEERGVLSQGMVIDTEQVNAQPCVCTS